MLPTSDRTYTIETYDAKTKTLLFTNEQVLNANYRDIGSLFSVFEQENGIQKLATQIEYINTVDATGRQIKTIEKEFQKDIFVETETMFHYLEADQQNNPTIFTQQKTSEEEPFLLSTRQYMYY